MSVARGDPQVDINVLQSVKEAVKTVKKLARNLDDKTLADIASEFHAGLAVTEKYKGVRQTQRTAIVGGERRKRR
jgi:hypothetical protein